MGKHVLPLFLVAVVAVGAMFFTLQQQTPEQSDASQPLFPSLKQQAQSISEIRLENAAGVLLHAQKAEDKWLARLSDSRQFPADESELAELVNQLIDAVLLEAKTNRAENYAKLGLTAISDEDSQAVRVTLEGMQSWQLLIGNQASSGLGSYIRLPDEPQTWLLDTVISLPSDAHEWLMQPILPFTSKDIVQVERVGDESWLISRSEDSDALLLDASDESQPLRYEGVLESVFSNIASIRFDDITPASGVSVDPSTLKSELLVHTKQGNIMLRVDKIDDAHYLTVSTEISHLKYLASHRFEISAYTASQLTKVKADFLPEVEEADESEVEESDSDPNQSEDEADS